jgi:phosphomannomutase
LRRYHPSGEISRRVADADALLASLEEAHQGAAISRLDGLLVRYPDWWFNMRASNTEPVVRLNLEADSEAAMCARRDELVALMEAAG